MSSRKTEYLKIMIFFFITLNQKETICSYDVLKWVCRHARDDVVLIPAFLACLFKPLFTINIYLLNIATSPIDKM